MVWDKVPAGGKPAALPTPMDVAMAVATLGELGFTVQRVGRFNWTISCVIAASVQLLLKFIKRNQEVLTPVIVVQTVP